MANSELRCQQVEHLKNIASTCSDMSEMSECIEMDLDEITDAVNDMNASMAAFDEIVEECKRIRRHFIATMFAVGFISSFIIGIALNWNKFSRAIRQFKLQLKHMK